MKYTSKMFFLTTILATAFALSAAGMGMQAGTTPPAAPKTAPAKTTTKKTEATPPPTAAEIADAKAKNMVWVNLGTGVYHKDGEFFGKTKRGKFMTEDDAKKGGYRAAKEPAKKAAKTDVKK